jgi:hypothetical protein
MSAARRSLRSRLARLGDPLGVDRVANDKRPSAGRAILGVVRTVIEWPVVFAEWAIRGGLALRERARRE